MTLRLASPQIARSVIKLFSMAIIRSVTDALPAVRTVNSLPCTTTRSHPTIIVIVKRDYGRPLTSALVEAVSALLCLVRCGQRMEIATLPRTPLPHGVRIRSVQGIIGGTP